MAEIRGARELIDMLLSKLASAPRVLLQLTMPLPSAGMSRDPQVAAT